VGVEDERPDREDDRDSFRREHDVEG
jgi:hypothetical protein